MWCVGEVVEARGGLSQQLDQVLKVYQAVYSSGEPPLAEEIEEVCQCLAQDRTSVLQLQARLPEISPDLSAPFLTRVVSIHELYGQVGECYLEAMDLLEEFLRGGDQSLVPPIRDCLENASINLERADALTETLK